MIKEAIGKAVRLQNLTEAESSAAMSEIMSGEATEAQIAAFITALRMKGETTDEITGCAKMMKKFATPIRVRSLVEIAREDINEDDETVIDTCGTGGDGTNTFNVSTATAFVVCACGLRVAKHGNRSVSSACGSADVLEALGVNLNVTTEKVEECISKVGIGFLYAPSLHGAMKYAIGPRKQIGIRTIFNLLGPLTNPAGATAQVLGVYDEKLVPIIADVLKNMGTKRAWVVHGKDGLDEISISSETEVAELKDGKVSLFTINPDTYGIKRANIPEIKGGSATDNAVIIRKILNGDKGPKRDIVVLNAAAGLYVGEKASDIKEGLKMAQDAIDSGKAKEKLELLIKITNE